MDVFSFLFILLSFFVGSSFADSDLRRRQQCISKCVTNNKGKILRGMHRMFCKIKCNNRHGGMVAEENMAVHPAFNGKDAFYNS